jgi:uncharacterized protein (DUF4415 family)
MEYLKERCKSCGSYRWCGRDCANAPKSDQEIQREVEIPEPEKPVLKERPVRKEKPVVKKPDARKPPNPHNKVWIGLRVDPEIASHFQALGKNWRAVINEILLREVRK